MLVIDSRERAGSKLVELVEYHAKYLSIEMEKKWIEVGDYVFDDMCFEAKSTVDFLGSLMNKRMWNQIDNMDRHYKHNFVIIYGSLNEAVESVISNSKSKMPHGTRAVMLKNKFLGGISRIALDTDTKPLWVESEKEAALLITAFCKVKPLNREAIRPEVIKRVTTEDLRIDVLSTIKGVSVKKAKMLLKQFGSIQEIGLHTVQDLTKLDGIGEKTASRILDVLFSEKKVKI